MDNYEILIPLPNGIQVIHRLSDNAYIPMDPNNSDYQRYLKDIANV